MYGRCTVDVMSLPYITVHSRTSTVHIASCSSGYIRSFEGLCVCASCDASRTGRDLLLNFGA